MCLDTLALDVQTAKRDLERARILFANKLTTYENMTAAAKTFSDLFYNYQKIRYPAMKAKRIPVQALLR